MITILETYIIEHSIAEFLPFVFDLSSARECDYSKPIRSRFFAKILLLQVKVIQGFTKTLYGPEKSSSTSTTIQVSPFSRTDEIRHLGVTHA